MKTCLYEGSWSLSRLCVALPRYPLCNGPDDPPMFWIRRRRARQLPGLKPLTHNYSYCYISVQQTREKLLTDAASTRRLSADQFAYTNFDISVEKMQTLRFDVNIHTPLFFFFFFTPIWIGRLNFA
jgi:hypothetical protein